jgi:putative membrane protein
MTEGTGSNRAALMGVLSTSGVILAFLVWLIYFKTSAVTHSSALGALPGVNACLNALSACWLVAGFLSIRRGHPRLHVACMLVALLFSAAFLVGYIVYHSTYGDTTFLGQGAIRYVYFFILISHIVLTVVVLPLILMTLYLAVTRQFSSHKRLARWTLPLWLYVSVTGVLIYLLLRNHS